MSQVRWGILSTAKIGVKQVIPAMQQSESCEIVAIASRSKDKADRAASQLKIPKTYGSYEEMLDDPDIDAIYNPLPNNLHVPWTIKAIEANKHVLCEKPIGLNAGEAEKLAEVMEDHSHLKVMEAFMYRFHPQWRKARQLVEEQKIGQVKTIQSFFSYNNTDPDNIRNDPEKGGGGLMDIGCYQISLSRFIYNEEPRRIKGMMEFDPEFNVDRLTSGMLEFSHGTSTFTCSTQISAYQRVNILGTEGRIEIEIPFNPPADKPTRLWLTQGDNTQEIEFDICNHYTIQGELFSQAVVNNNPVPTPISDAIANMKVIDAIQKSAETNAWVSDF